MQPSPMQLRHFPIDQHKPIDFENPTVQTLYTNLLESLKDHETVNSLNQNKAFRLMMGVFAQGIDSPESVVQSLIECETGMTNSTSSSSEESTTVSFHEHMGSRPFFMCDTHDLESSDEGFFKRPNGTRVNILDSDSDSDSISLEFQGNNPGPNFYYSGQLPSPSTRTRTSSNSSSSSRVGFEGNTSSIPRSSQPRSVGEKKRKPKMSSGSPGSPPKTDNETVLRCCALVGVCVVCITVLLQINNQDVAKKFATRALSYLVEHVREH
eukprot:TRINITY_DN7387_c0_g1_i15.p1 TRINITY_DN7387_c0_g1~~TRINITY_DN7387_c0_g1_i15.p1  ORF type:complete len:267 (-),score=38.29 TRINITY_DN7387_c0_g1_i15:224-1024(-)